MRGRPLAARRVVVLAPHPDDETIGAWGLMRRLARAGARIEVVVVSDGGASHPGSRAWPRARLVAERRRETRRALRPLGLAPPAIRFLGLPDGQLGARGTVRAVARALHRRPCPDLIVGPDRDDAHADHAAVAAAIAQVRRRGEQRLAYHVWPHGRARGRRPCRVALDGAALAAKRRTLRGYRTQAGLITDADAGSFAMTHHHLAAFARPQERFAVLA